MLSAPIPTPVGSSGMSLGDMRPLDVTWRSAAGSKGIHGALTFVIMGSHAVTQAEL